MNRLPFEKRVQILKMLVEGNSMRATARVVDVSINTVTKLFLEVGQACAEYQDAVFRNLKCKRIQCDEIWSFVGMKAKNVPDDLRGVFGYGDVYTWTAIDADTKLMPCWHLGGRDGVSAQVFMKDLASRLSHRVQLTTDGNKAYLEAVELAFGSDVDFAQLVKLYGAPSTKEEQRRYSPAEVIGIEKHVVYGNPEAKAISTSYVERANLTMRMHMRRFTRLTNGFSKKLENHMQAISLHFMFYNFARIHKSLRVTPAMEAGVADHVWTIDEIVRLVPEPIAKKRGQYKPRAFVVAANP
ncbi:MAG TPA: IS1 family transposase [Rhizomicrobium sp.]|nr:IS1 family transposase [Rhizomicrobium sp.]